MSAWPAIYTAQTKRAFAIWLQYRAAAIIWMIGFIVQPVMYLVVWTTVAESSGGSVGGYTPADFAAYYIVLMVVDQLTYTWVQHEFDYRVREGEFSRLLLLPIHPMHEDIADNFAYKALTLVILLPAVLLMTWFFNPVYATSWQNVALFVPAVIISFWLRFFMGWVLGMLAFWTTRISALIRMYSVIKLFFSGRLAPLSLLPPMMFALARVLPFMWELAFPVELFLGRLSADEIWFGFGMQLLWTAVMFVAFKLMWRRAVRRYSAFGS
jgi:ABC-2 type transport system permease protein